MLRYQKNRIDLNQYKVKLYQKYLQKIHDLGSRGSREKWSLTLVASLAQYIHVLIECSFFSSVINEYVSKDYSARVIRHVFLI